MACRPDLRESGSSVKSPSENHSRRGAFFDAEGYRGTCERVMGQKWAEKKEVLGGGRQGTKRMSKVPPSATEDEVFMGSAYFSDLLGTWLIL